VGYTVNFERRLRQHNGEIVGGAKKTHKARPWYPICVINGFYEASSALRFEYRMQHPKLRRKKTEDPADFLFGVLTRLIATGDGSIAKQNKMPWSKLNITWYPITGHKSTYFIDHTNITNQYIDIV
jgi:hypothetical protein